MMEKIFARYLEVRKELDEITEEKNLWKEEGKLEKEILKILRKAMKKRGLKIPKSISATIGNYKISSSVDAPGISGYQMRVKKIK